MTESGSTVPRRQLGRELRSLRDDRHIRAEDIADQLEWSRSKIWRIETGQSPVKKVDVLALASAYQTSPETTDLLLGLAAESKNRGWWHSYGDVIPDWFEMYVGLEAVAEHIRHYDAELIPGLLQTEEYCRAIYRVSSTDGWDVVERRVALRMERKALLTREAPQAPRFDVFLNEAVIRRVVGGPDVMKRQLKALVEITDLPNVEVRILPFAAGEHAAMMSTFVLLSFPDLREPDVVYLESQTGGLYLDKPKEVTRYNFMLRDLERRALDSAQSRALIAAVMREM